MVCWPFAGYAQTTITPSGGPQDLGTTVANPIPAQTVITGGTRPSSGQNLFHSFDAFSVGAGHTATFVVPNDNSVRNVVSRVTGGSVTTIDGTVAAKLGNTAGTNGTPTSVTANTNLFLINPNGVVVGATGTVDTNGAFAASSAQSVGFAGGARFDLSSTGGSLTVADPLDFGFLAGGAGKATFSGAMAGGSGDSAVSFGENIDAGAKPIDLAVRGVKDVTVQAGVTLESQGAGGFHFNSDDRIVVNGWVDGFNISGANAFAFNARKVEMTVAGRLQHGSWIVNPSAITIRTADGLEIDAAGSGADKAGIYSNDPARFIFGSGSNPSGDGPNIFVSGGGVELRNGGLIRAQTTGGTAGDITLNLDGELRLLSGSEISNRGLVLFGGGEPRSGRAGSTSVNASQVTITGGASINSTVDFQLGTAGPISVGSRSTISISGSGSSVRSEAFGCGGLLGGSGCGSISSSTISLTAPSDILIENGGVVSTVANGRGSSGDIFIESTAGQLVMTGPGSKIKSGDGGSAAQSGDLVLHARTMSILNGAEVSSASGAILPAGAISVQTKRFELNNAKIRSSAGNVSVGLPPGVSAGALSFVVTTDAAIADSGLFKVINGATIDSSTFGAGPAGDILVDARQIEIDGMAAGSWTNTGLFSRGSVFVTQGVGGEIRLNASEDITVRNAQVNSSTQGSGWAGSIIVAGKDLFIGPDGRFSSTTSGEGRGGNITFGLSGDLEMAGDESSGRPAIIEVTALAGSTGDGGTITINSDELKLLSNAQINSDTNGPGRGGNVIVNVRAMEFRDHGSINAQTVGVAGRGGDIKVTATEDIKITGGDHRTGLLSGTTAGSTGPSGDIFVSARNLTLNAGAELSTKTLGAGDAGTVDIRATNSVTLTSDGTVETVISSQAGDAATRVGGRAGFVAIETPSLVMECTGAAGACSFVTHSEGVAVDPKVRITTVSNSSNVADRASGIFLALGTTLSGQQAAILSDSFGSQTAGAISIRDASFQRTMEGALALDSLGRPQMTDVAASLADLDLDLQATLISTQSGRGASIVAETKLTPTIDIFADDLTLRFLAGAGRTGSISTDTLAPRRAGDVFIDADTIALSGSTYTDVAAMPREANSAITSQGRGVASAGASGNVTIVANRNATSAVTLNDYSFISTTTFGDNNAGTIDIKASNLNLAGATRAAISSASNHDSQNGRAGNVIIDARVLSMTGGGASITSISESEPRAGSDVNVPTIGPNKGAGTVMIFGLETLTMSGGASISSSSLTFNQRANIPRGDPRIATPVGYGQAAAGVVLLTSSARPAGAAFTALFNEAQSPDLEILTAMQASRLPTVSATAKIDISGAKTGITSKSDTAGSAGNVLLYGFNEIVVAGGASIASDANVSAYSAVETSRRAGIVDLLATSIEIGGGAEVSSAVRLVQSYPDYMRVLAGTPAGISPTDALDVTPASFARAGDVRLRGGTLEMNGGTIEALSESRGDAGSVAIDMSGAVSIDGSTITSQATGTSRGFAGSVAMTGQFITLKNDSKVFTQVGEGRPLSLGEVQPPSFVSLTSTGADSEGRGIFLDRAEIRTTTFGLANAGKIELQALGGDLAATNTLMESRNASTSSAAAGDIKLHGRNRVVLDGSGIADGIFDIASITSGSGLAGAITVTADGLGLELEDAITIKEMTLISSTFGGGSSGRIDVRANAGSILFDGSDLASSSFGELGDANELTVNAVFGNIVSQKSLLRSDTIRSGNPANGDAGDIILNAGNRIEILGTHDDLSFSVQSTTQGAGRSGVISLTAGAADETLPSGVIQPAIALRSAIIFSENFGSGRADDVSLTATNGGIEAESSLISSAVTSPTGTGVAGAIKMTAASLLDLENSFVTSLTNGSGAGGNIDLNAARIVAAGSTLSSQTRGEGDAGDVTFRATGPDVSPGGMPSAAALVVENSRIVSQTARVSTAKAGSVTFQSDLGSTTIWRQTAVSADTSAAGSGGNISVLSPNGKVTIGDKSIFDQTRLESKTFGDGDAGAITIKGQDVAILSGARLGAESDFGEGDAGSILIESNTSVLLDAGIYGPGGLISTGPLNITSRTGAAGTSNGVRIVALDGDVDVLNGVSVESRAFGRGDAGSIVVLARSGQIIVDASSLNSESLGVGVAGSVELEAEQIGISNGSRLTVEVQNGNAASTKRSFVRLTASAADTNGTGIEIDSSTVSASTFGLRNAGDVTLTSSGGDIVLSNDAVVLSSAEGAGVGNAGEVLIDANAFDIDISDSIVASAARAFDPSTGDFANRGPGSAGKVMLKSRHLTMSGGEVSAQVGQGCAAPPCVGPLGDITVILSGDLTLSDGAEISATTFGTAQAGKVDIKTQALRMTSRAEISSESSGVLATGPAGEVLLDASSIVIDDATISSRSTSLAAAGRVGIFGVATLDMTDGAEISSSAQWNGTLNGSSAAAGQVLITSAPRSSGSDGSTAAARESLRAAAATGQTIVTLSGAKTQISSLSNTKGSAGNVLLYGLKTLEMSDGARLSSEIVVPVGGESTAGQTAGTIEIVTTDLTMSGAASISSATLYKNHKGSPIDRNQNDPSLLSTATAGNVFIGSSGLGTAVLIEGSSITSESQTLGNGGSVRLGTLAGFKLTPGRTNDVSIKVEAATLEDKVPYAFKTITLRDSQIFSRARGGNDEDHKANAGDIEIAAKDRIYLLRSDVFSLVSRPDDGVFRHGDGGRVIIDPVFFVMNRSTVDSSADLNPNLAGDFGGNGGAIFVRSDFFFRSQGVFNTRGRVAGNVRVTGPEVDVSAGIIGLDPGFLNVLDRLPQQCSARLGRPAGSLTPLGRGGMQLGPLDFGAVSPGDQSLLPGFATLEDTSQAAAEAAALPMQVLAAFAVGASPCH